LKDYYLKVVALESYPAAFIHHPGIQLWLPSWIATLQLEYDPHLTMAQMKCYGAGFQMF